MTTLSTKLHPIYPQKLDGQILLKLSFYCQNWQQLTNEKSFELEVFNVIQSYYNNFSVSCIVTKSASVCY